ncbi:MAG: OmpH family outer membrane protein [Bacteroidales bacterium]|nr:OmpH family outer membrane protein [Bacteroidales bacterium]MBP3254838.1 OmpH family outer membrane protein [Bacteroidales bacterium]MBQ7984637.1 OmpH family outer membrane protein [Bacteroidales bacterium]
MKKTIVLTLMMVCTLTAMSQKFACVDSDYILNNMPEYKQAQKELEDASLQWQKEVENKLSEVDKMYKQYQAEAVLMPSDLKTKKENEIIAAEKSAKNLQKQRFGSDGDLAKKRAELIKPIQDKVYNAIEKLAQEKNLNAIFDKAGGAALLYVDDKTDISDLVLAELGYKVSGTTKKKQ